MSLQIKDFFDHGTSTFTYVVTDTDTKESAIIDPVLNYDQFSGEVSYKSAMEILQFVNTNQLNVKYILETHIHADHLTAAQYLKKKLGAKIGVGAKIKEVLQYWVPLFNTAHDTPIDASQFDMLFTDGEEFKLGSFMVKVIHTPGHTPACSSYIIADAIFVGDTIFMPDVGCARADFPGGDAAKLYDSIKKILSLPSAYRIYVCHDYAPNTREPTCMTSVQEENQSNIMLNQSTDKQGFIDKRSKRDKTLAVPKLLYPSLQVNLRAGYLGDKDTNGRRYIKIPVTIND